MSDDVAGDCTKDIAARIAVVLPLDSQHVFVVTDENDLVKQIQTGVKTPFAGVIYGGLQAREGADPSRQGRAVDLRVGVFFGVTGRTIGNADTKPATWALLSAVRKAIIGQRSPTGHHWRFLSESFLGSKNDASYYSQHWGTFTAIG